MSLDVRRENIGEKIFFHIFIYFVDTENLPSKYGKNTHNVKAMVKSPRVASDLNFEYHQIEKKGEVREEKEKK